MKILIVDDDDALRMWLVQKLGPLGFAVHEAANGDEAFWIYKGSDFEFVLSDYQFLPGHEIKNGVQLAIAIHGINQDQRMALHTSDPKLIVRSMLPVGLQDITVLKKPCSIHRLMHVMKYQRDSS